MMISAIKSTLPKDWDFEWDYSMGDLENFGFKKIVRGNSLSALTEEGLLLSAGDNNSLVQYDFPIELTEDGVCECEVRFLEANSPLSQGFRLRLSSSSTQGNAISFAAVNTGLTFDAQTFYRDVKLNQWYKIKIIYKKDIISEVYLDDTLIFSQKKFVTQYIYGNKLFQQGGGKTLWRSLKYKFYDNATFKESNDSKIYVKKVN